MFKWIKLVFSSKATLIRMMDQLEPILAAKIQEYQTEAGKLDATILSKRLVDTIQKWACKVTKTDPSEVGL